MTPVAEDLREAALRRFNELGFPTTRDEEWRFTNVAPIARSNFPVASVVGQAVPPAQPGLTVTTLAAAADEAAPHLGRYASWESNPFTALNTAHAADGIFIRVARNAVIDRPIEIAFEATNGQTFHPRVLILIGAGAQCTIVEHYRGQGAYFTNAVTEIAAGEGAVVDHYKIQREDPSAYHVASMQVALGRSTNFFTHSISLGGALVRNDIGATLSEGSHATMNGLYLVNGAQHVDNHTVIDHAMPNATSHELYKGILDGKSSAVFNGRIIVRKDAQKTDSKQTNKNLVLSDDAVIDTKPELQIHADDVRCTHGATIGQIDAEALFYLQSRGIGRQHARSILTYAFAQDIISRIKVQPLAQELERVLLEKFQ